MNLLGLDMSKYKSEGEEEEEGLPEPKRFKADSSAEPSLAQV